MATTAEARTTTIDPMHAEAVGHGNSVAAWAAVGVMLVATLVACVGFALANTTIFWVGVVLIPVGLLVGFVLKKAGYGVGGSKSKGH
jgi:hypothetical protein